MPSNDGKGLYNSAGESRVVYNELEEKDANARGFTLTYDQLPFNLREYPKALYMGGDRGAAHVVVRDDAEERTARKDGFKMIDKGLDAISAKRLGVDEPAAAEEAAPVAKSAKKGK